MPQPGRPANRPSGGFRVAAGQPGEGSRAGGGYTLGQALAVQVLFYTRW